MRALGIGWMSDHPTGTPTMEMTMSHNTLTVTDPQVSAVKTMADAKGFEAFQAAMAERGLMAEPMHVHPKDGERNVPGAHVLRPTAPRTRVRAVGGRHLPVLLSHTNPGDIFQGRVIQSVRVNGRGHVVIRTTDPETGEGRTVTEPDRRVEVGRP